MVDGAGSDSVGTLNTEFDTSDLFDLSSFFEKNLNKNISTAVQCEFFLQIYFAGLQRLM